MIDVLVAELKVEQEADEKKKEYCAVEFDTSEDKHKVLTKSISDLESAIAESEEGITTTKAEIEALSDNIKALAEDSKSMSDAEALLLKPTSRW